MGGERDKAQEGGGGKTKNSVALRCNRPSGLGVDARMHFIIDLIKKLGMKSLCSHNASYTRYKVRDKCPSAQDTHRQLSIHLGGVDDHKDLLNGAGCSSLYQVILYRAHDR